VYGYELLDIFVEGAKKAGANLTTDSFIAAMERFKREPDMFGSPVMTWSSEMRLGNAKARLSQIQDGRWKVVSDYK
jgi:branched-chain amino acid transport system substrate-binding protein